MSTIKVNTLTTLNGSGNITVSRPLSGSGASLTALNATELTSGTVPTARLGSGTANNGVFLRGDGTWDTAGSTSASDLSSGTLPMARLSGTLPALNGSALTALPAANLTGTIAAISGVNLTALNASQVTSGTIPMARLSGTLPALNGSALTALNASNISSGTIAAARTTTEVFAGNNYNSSINTPGIYTVTGVGFQPDVIWVSQIANRAAPGVSYGFADSTEEGCFAQYNAVGSADTWNDDQPYLFRLFSSSGNSTQATLTSMNADGFTYTITETGTFTTADGTMMFICWKA